MPSFIKLRIKPYLLVSRPYFWLIPIFSYALGYFSNTTFVHPLIIFNLFLLSFPYNFFLYYVNDVIDISSDSHNPRKRNYLSSTNTHISKIIIFLFLIIFILVSLMSLNLFIVLISLSFILVSYYYSAFPIRAKTRPPLDVVFSGFLYFFLPCLLGIAWSNSLDFNNFLKVLLITFIITGIHSYTTLVDYSYDKKIGDTTIAVKYGKKLAFIYTLVTFLPFILFGYSWFPNYLYFYTVSIFLFLTGTYFYLNNPQKLEFFSKLIYISFIFLCFYYLLNSFITKF